MSISFNNDWTQFTRRVFIRADKQEVFDAWSKQGEMEEWFLKRAQFYDNGTQLEKGKIVTKDCSFEWTWYGWPEMIQKGEMLDVVRNEKIVFSFDPAGIVTLRFEQHDENTTQLILEQTGIATDEESKKNFFYGCSLGWSFWMVNLKAWLEHGILLDERVYNFDDARKLETVNQ